MRTFVTGGTGFVGANLVRRLLADGHEVHLLVRPTARRWRLHGIERDLVLHDGDVADADSVRAAVRQARPDWIFHLAVHGAYSFETDVAAMIRTNVLGTANLLAAAAEAGCAALVNTGSSSEYGPKDHAPREDEALEPDSYYAVAKAAATWLCRVSTRDHGLHVPTLRLYSVYGPYEDGRRLMPTLVRHGLRGVWPPLAAPDIARDYVYVDDAVEAYLLAASHRGGVPDAVYNVGTGRQTTLAELAELARGIFALSGEPVWGTYAPRAWDTGVWVAAPQRIQATLGWQPRFDLAHGLRALAAWMQDHQSLYAGN